MNRQIDAVARCLPHNTTTTNRTTGKYRRKIKARTLRRAEILAYKYTSVLVARPRFEYFFVTICIAYQMSSNAM